MLRKAVVVGDPPMSGGAVLPYVGPLTDMYGHRVALIGGRAYCEGCNSVGIIAKAGGPRRGVFHGAEIALEGDVVVCCCSVPPALVAKAIQTVFFDDGLGGAEEFRGNHALTQGWYSASASDVAMSKRIVDELVEHPSEAEQTENICPNMTNKAFCHLVLELRSDAVKLVTQRLRDLDVWSKEHRARAKEWFGTDDDAIREYLKGGLSRCLQVLNGLTCDNFVRYSEESMALVGCTAVKDRRGLVAGVCKPDVTTHTIGINIDFCFLRTRSAESDSQLQALIHEVTHFDDTFGSDDDVYKMTQSLSIAGQTGRAMKNADSITGYIAFGASHAN